MRVLLVSANRERLPSPVVPLGVLSVAAAVRDEHEVRVLDLCFEPDPHGAIRRAIAAFAPEVVGIGLRNLHSNAYDGMERLTEQVGSSAVSVVDVGQHILEDVRQFVGGVTQSDDMCLVCFGRLE